MAIQRLSPAIAPGAVNFSGLRSLDHLRGGGRCLGPMPPRSRPTTPQKAKKTPEP
ncbi:MAG: hypothetical protein MH825_03025 [Cyanobacteria bacterium]|nr:hypothetical protein [Cyanobacteriota bacterium]